MAGFAAPQVGHGGGAGLVPLICAHIPANAPPLLWPAARDRGFDMVAALAPDRAVEDVSVYAMEQTPRLSDDALDALAYGKILAVKLMSARSATLFCAQLAENGMDHCRPEIIIIAGSETIAAAAGGGWRQTYIAKRPTRVRLLAIASLLYHRREVLD
jgi:uroporphyrinogen-III synthase